MYGRFLNMRQRVLHGAGEGVLRDGFRVLSSVDGRLRGFHDPITFERGNFDYPAAQRPGKFLNIDLVAVFLDHIHHVDGDNHGYSKLR